MSVTLTITNIQDAKDAIIGDNPEFEIVREEKSLGELRWAAEYEVILKQISTGLYWAATYMRGTGDEGERPYEYDKEAVWDQVTKTKKWKTVYKKLV